MKSIFTIKSYFLLLLIALFFAVIILMVLSALENHYEIFFYSPLLVFVILWLVFGELRTKMIKITLNDNLIIINKFAGFYKDEIIYYSEIDGYKLSILRSDSGSYEYLYLMKNNKKAVKISEFYHKNYFELKGYINDKIKYIGKEEFSYIDEFKEIFS